MKKKKISQEQYIKLFCSEKRIRARKVLYVSAETHRKITRIAHMFSDDHTTVSSFVDAILLNHIEQYRDLINDLIESQDEELIP